MEYGIYVVIAIVVVSLGLLYLLFKGKRIKNDFDFSQTHRDLLKENVSFYRKLEKEERKTFEDDIKLFLSNVAITGIDIEISDLDKVLVAASAVIPLFGFPGWYYRNINEVLLYKSSFNRNLDTTGKDRNILGMVGSGNMQRMMILSQPALLDGFQNASKKENVGIHEFVHLLDKADGTIDGIPRVLIENQYVIPWVKKMEEEIADILQRNSDIRPYGASNQAEFLSVVSEYFFKRPMLLSKKHPELFDLLEKLYNQDLA